MEVPLIPPLLTSSSIYRIRIVWCDICHAVMTLDFLCSFISFDALFKPWNNKYVFFFLQWAVSATGCYFLTCGTKTKLSMRRVNQVICSWSWLEKLNILQLTHVTTIPCLRVRVRVSESFATFHITSAFHHTVRQSVTASHKSKNDIIQGGVG